MGTVLGFTRHVSPVQALGWTLLGLLAAWVTVLNTAVYATAAVTNGTAAGLWSGYTLFWGVMLATPVAAVVVTVRRTARDRRKPVTLVGQSIVALAIVGVASLPITFAGMGPF